MPARKPGKGGKRRAGAASRAQPPQVHHATPESESARLEQETRKFLEQDKKLAEQSKRRVEAAKKSRVPPPSKG
jgi:hypothetical protein